MTLTAGPHSYTRPNAATAELFQPCLCPWPQGVMLGPGAGEYQIWREGHPVRVWPGDYIITEPSGVRYPVVPEVFAGLVVEMPGRGY